MWWSTVAWAKTVVCPDESVSGCDSDDLQQVLDSGAEHIELRAGVYRGRFVVRGEVRMEGRPKAVILAAPDDGERGSPVLSVEPGASLTLADVIIDASGTDGDCSDGLSESPSIGLWVEGAKLRLEQVTVLDGQGEESQSPGGLFARDSELVALDTQWVCNHGLNGGALWASGSRLQFERVSFLGNAALLEGGALFASESSMSIVESRFTSNFAGSEGGAIVSRQRPEDTLTIERSELVANSAASGGHLSTAGGRVVLVDTLLDSGEAVKGSALMADGGTVELREGRIHGHWPLPLYGGYGEGTVVDVRRADFALDGTRFSSNTGTALLLEQVESPCLFGAIFDGNYRPGGTPALEAREVEQIEVRRSWFCHNGGYPDSGALSFRGGCREGCAVRESVFTENGRFDLEEMPAYGHAVNLAPDDEKARYAFEDNTFFDNGPNQGGAEGSVQGSVLWARGPSELAFHRNVLVSNRGQALVLEEGAQLSSALFNVTDSLEALGVELSRSDNYERSPLLGLGDPPCGPGVGPAASRDDRWIARRGLGALPYDLATGECLPIDADHDGVPWESDCNDDDPRIGACAARWSRCSALASPISSPAALLALAALVLARRRRTMCAQS